MAVPIKVLHRYHAHPIEQNVRSTKTWGHETSPMLQNLERCMSQLTRHEFDNKTVCICSLTTVFTLLLA